MDLASVCQAGKAELWRQGWEMKLAKVGRRCIAQFTDKAK